MRWLVSTITFVLLLFEAAVVTFFAMVLLNGLPSVPDVLVAAYLVGVAGTVLGLSVLGGTLAKRLHQRRSIPIWVTGILAAIASLVITPLALAGLLFVLLVGFGLS